MTGAILHRRPRRNQRKKAARMKSSARTRTQPLRLQPGLAVLRYTSGSSRQASTIQLELNDSVAAISEPGFSTLDLVRVGQCIVLRITEPTSVVMRNVPQAGAAHADVAVSLEYLTPLASPPPSVRVGRDAGRPADVATHIARDVERDTANLDLSILGHVSRLGDRRVSSGTWLAGPDRPLPIEGLAIRFADAPPALSLRYYASEKVDDFDPNRFVGEGEFSGSRGKARSIRQLFLKIEGPNRKYYDLSVDFMFLGSPIQASRGTDLRIQSPTGKEPLVGLRLAIIHTMKDPLERINRSFGGSDSGVLVF